MFNQRYTSEKLNWIGKVARTGWNLPLGCGQKQHLFLEKMHDVWGDCFQFPVGRRMATVMSHPAAVRQIFENRSGSLCAGTSRRMVVGVLPPKCIVYHAGDEQQNARKVVTSAFAKTIRNLDVAILIGQLMTRLKSNPDIEVGIEWFGVRLATEFSVGKPAEQLEQLILGTMDSLKPIRATAIVIPAIGKLPWHRRRLQHYEATRAELIGGIEAAQLTHDYGSQSFMHHLTVDPRAMKLGHEECCHNIAMFAMAITFNLRVVLLNVIRRLAGQTRYQDRLRQAVIQSMISENPIVDPARYARAIVRETLRMSPLVPLISRYVLEDTNVHGVLLKKGHLVFVSPWVSHFRRASFENPLLFDPERFLGSNQFENCYIPFGGGKRHCVATGWATDTMGQVLQSLVRNFSLHSDQSDLSGHSLRLEGFNLVPKLVDVGLAEVERGVTVNV